LTGDVPPLVRSELLRLLLQIPLAGIVVADRAGVIRMANGEAEHLFGYAPGEMAGLPVDALVPEALAPGHAAHRGAFHHQPSRHPRGKGRELTGRRKDGSGVQVEIGLLPVEDGTGEFVLASIIDISERRQAEDRLRHSMADRLAFLALVGDLSATFVNLRPEAVDDAIVDALRRICETLDLDRAVIFLREPGADDFLPSYRWGRAGVQLTAGRLSTKEHFPWFHERLLRDKVVAYTRVDDIPEPVTVASIRRFGAQAGCSVPFSIDGEVAGVVAFASVRSERDWPEHLVERLRLVARVVANVIRRKQADEALATALAEVKRLSDRLGAENVYLRQEVSQALGTTLVVGQSPAIAEVLEQVRQVAATDSNVLLLGETGSGKELIATQVHELSPRHDRLMVRVNCAAIPAALIESELFGREKGAYTGALTRQTGRFELADHSTLFLDEIGDLPLDVQVKLLRVIEDRHVDRLGGNRPVKVDVRIIAATHRNLEEMVAQGTFREDLYYRLNVFPIRVPPLRERPDDIPILVWRFVEEFSKRFGKTIDSIAKDSMSALQQYAWPGNVRELRNVVERAMIVTKPGKLVIALPQPTGKAAASSGAHTLRDMEIAHVTQVLTATAWRIRGAGGAAERLGLKPSTLETRMAKLGIRRPAKI